MNKFIVIAKNIINKLNKLIEVYGLNSDLNFSKSYYLKQKIIDTVYKIFRAILLFGLCFLILQPIFDKISVSFMAEMDLYDASVVLIPRNVTTDNFKLVNRLINYWPSLLQTGLIVFASALLQVTACAVTAYGFARYKFPLKNFWFTCVMLTIVVPPQTIMSSLYLNFRFFDFFGLIGLITGNSLNLLSNFGGYFMLSATCMGLKNGLYILILRQYFRGVPKELEEAAWVDGCGKYKTFFRIMIPDAAPMLTSCFLFSFVWQWTDSLFTTLFLDNYSILSTGLGALYERTRRWWMIMSAGSSDTYTLAPVAFLMQMNATGVLMCIAPLILLYLLAQRAFVESLNQTGIKM